MQNYTIRTYDYCSVYGNEMITSMWLCKLYYSVKHSHFNTDHVNGNFFYKLMRLTNTYYVNGYFRTLHNLLACFFMSSRKAGSNKHMSKL
jgi:hypothetical protein